MLSQYYTKPENRINFIINNPNHGIKCTICELIFPVQQIDRHMTTHIAPHFNAPNTTNNKLKKMSRPKLFMEEKQNSFMQTALKTVKSDNMPQNQTLRKLHRTPSNLTQLPNNQVQYNIYYQNEPSNINQNDIQATFQIHNVDKQFPQREEIRQDMILDRQNVHVKKSTLQVYAAEKTKRQAGTFNSTQSSFENFKRIQSKMKINTKFQDSTNQTEQTQAYQISQKRTSKFEEFIRVFLTAPEQQRQVKIQKSKPPEVRSQSISTKSNKISELKKSPSFQLIAQFFGCGEAPKDLKKGEVTMTMNMQNTAATRQFWRSGNVSLNKAHLHQCHECGGFYCSTCHSTIPPQYRPKMMSSSVNEETTSFYNKLYFENKKCQDCNE